MKMIEVLLNESYRVKYCPGFKMILILRTDGQLLTKNDWYDEYMTMYPVAVRYLKSEGFLQ